MTSRTARDTIIARPPGSLRSRVAASEPGGWRLACATLLVLIVGRVGEILPGLQGIPTVKIGLGIAVLCLAAAWSRLRKNSLKGNPLVRPFGWILLLACLSVVFSVWKMQSVAFILSSLAIVASLFFIIYVTSTNHGVIRTYITALGVSAVLLAVATVIQATPGRAFVSSSYDPNDLALVLVVVAPLMLARAYVSTALTRQLWFTGMGVVVFAALLTQSRGAFLGLLVAAVYLSVRGVDPIRKTKQVKIRRGPGLAVRIAVVALGAIFTWAALPQDAKERLSSTFSIEGDYNITDKRDGRIAIWTRAVDAMVQRPWGYGVGAFIHVEGQHGGRYKAAHNSMLQIGVELGVLGLIFFLKMFHVAWKSLGRIVQSLSSGNARPEDADARVLANGLRASLLAMFVTGSFLSQAYSPLLYAVIALAAALAVLHGDTRQSGALMPGGMRRVRAQARVPQRVSR